MQGVSGSRGNGAELQALYLTQERRRYSTVRCVKLVDEYESERSQHSFSHFLMHLLYCARRLPFGRRAHNSTTVPLGGALWRK